MDICLSFDIYNTQKKKKKKEEEELQYLIVSLRIVEKDKKFNKMKRYNLRKHKGKKKKKRVTISYCEFKNSWKRWKI